MCRPWFLDAWDAKQVHRVCVIWISPELIRWQRLFWRQSAGVWSKLQQPTLRLFTLLSRGKWDDRYHLRRLNVKLQLAADYLGLPQSLLNKTWMSYAFKNSFITIFICKNGRLKICSQPFFFNLIWTPKAKLSSPPAGCSSYLATRLSFDKTVICVFLRLWICSFVLRVEQQLQWARLERQQRFPDIPRFYKIKNKNLNQEPKKNPNKPWWSSAQLSGAVRSLCPKLRYFAKLLLSEYKFPGRVSRRWMSQHRVGGIYPYFQMLKWTTVQKNFSPFCCCFDTFKADTCCSTLRMKLQLLHSSFVFTSCKGCREDTFFCWLTRPRRSTV